MAISEKNGLSIRKNLTKIFKIISNQLPGNADKYYKSGGVENLMRRTILISFLMAYQIFMPFALVNCGSDKAFESTKADETVNCDQKFLVQDCVDKAIDEANPDEEAKTLKDPQEPTEDSESGDEKKVPLETLLA